MLEAFERAKGKGKKPPTALWLDRPKTGTAPTDADPIEQWQGEDTGDEPAKATTKRQRRNIREALLYRSFRTWVTTREEVRTLPLL